MSTSTTEVTSGAAFQALLDLVCTVDADGRIRSAHGALPELPGAHVVGAHCLAWVHERDRGRAEAALRHALTSGEATGFECAAQGHGEPQPLFQVTLTPVAAGETGQLVMIARDVTGRRRDELRLAENEQRYRQLFEVINQGIVFQRADGRVVDANPAAEDILGFSLEQLRGSTSMDPPWRSIHEDGTAFPGSEHPASVALRTATSIRNVVMGVFHPSKGEHRWILVSAVPQIPPGASGPTAVYSSFIDVTERVQAQRALRESEARLQSILDNTGLVVFLKDLEGRYLMVNRRYEELFHVTRQSVRGKTDYDLFSKEHADRFQQHDRLAFEKGTPVEVEELVPQDDGLHTYLSNKFPLYESGGKAYGVCGIATDVTERKNATEALARASREWLAAMDDSDDVICLLDLQRHIIRANRAFYLATGTTPEGAIGRHIAGVVHPTGEVASCVVCRAQEDRRDLQVIMEADQPDNMLRRPLELTLKVIRDQDQRPLSMLMTLHDLTAARRGAEEKAALESQLQQAQRLEAVGRLAGGVAHDFNNMLSVILGNAELALREAAPASPVQGALEEIRAAATRSANLTRQLLAFARKQAVSPRVLDLNETVTGIVAMMKRLIGEDIDLQWKPGPTPWPVKMDPTQLDQILANLCINARDAIGGVGRISVETRNCVLDDAACASRPDAAPGEYVQLEVRDSGRGMDQATMAHIFEPFFSTKGVGEGTGLGLATVYGIVRQNKGFIDVVSEPGRGATFTIHLRRHQGPQEGAATTGAVDSVPRGRETILLVEDEPAILRLAARMLTGLGYAVRTAGTPAEALRLVRESGGEIHLLVTDVVMPEMNGRELATALRATSAKLKTLFMSGYTADIISDRGVLDEGVHFIQKPFTMEALAAKVREVLDRP